MGRILIDNLRIYAFHGVLPQEREVGNDYVITLEIEYPIEKAFESDDINDTLNYAEVAETVKEVMKQPSNLLEHVAGRIIKALSERYALIESITLSIRKISPPMHFDVDSAGVKVTWKCK